MLSPPRLPAFCTSFHAGALCGRGRALYGLNGGKRYMMLHADPCTLCMHGSLQSGWPEKGLQKNGVQT